MAAYFCHTELITITTINNNDNNHDNNNNSNSKNKNNSFTIQMNIYARITYEHHLCIQGSFKNFIT